MDPRTGLLAVLASAFAEGIPEVKQRVDVMRIEPIWGEEELPIILIDLDDERIEERTRAPRDYEHTLTFSVIVYTREKAGKKSILLLNLVGAVCDLMSEWQFILASDVDPAFRKNGDRKLIETITLGNSINYFKSTAGNEDHQAARLAFEATFFTSGASTGLPRDGAPPRNQLADFDEMAVEWTVRQPAGLTALDRYRMYSIGDTDEP